MTRRHHWPTRYTAGPYRLVRINRTGGYAVAHAGSPVRYAVTDRHPVTGRPIARRMTLPAALEAMHELQRP